MWVRGHQGEAGNEEADKRAKREVRMEERMHMPDITTPAFGKPIHQGSAAPRMAQRCGPGADIYSGPNDNGCLNWGRRKTLVVYVTRRTRHTCAER